MKAARRIVAAALSVPLAACATRAVSPVSAQAAGAPTAPAAAHEPVVRALGSDVPLPGESLDGWSGLEDELPADAPPAHEHGGHEGHGHEGHGGGR